MAVRRRRPLVPPPYPRRNPYTPGCVAKPAMLRSRQAPSAVGENCARSLAPLLQGGSGSPLSNPHPPCGGTREERRGMGTGDLRGVLVFWVFAGGIVRLV